MLNSQLNPIPAMQTSRPSPDVADFDGKAAALEVLRENCGKTEMSTNLLGMWMSLLAPYTVEQVQAGVVRVIGTYVYKGLPPFAVLRQAIHEACGLPDPDAPGAATADLDAEAESAWAQMFGQIREVGGYGKPQLDEAQAYAVRICGGWEHLCSCPRTEVSTWKRKDFAGAYKNYKRYGSAMDEGPGAVRRAVEARRQAQALHGEAAKMIEEK